MFPWFTGVVGLDKSIIGQFFCYVQGNESQELMDSLKDVAMIPFNFSFKENHMWYIYLLIEPSSIPIPLQVPLMAVGIFLCSWAFTALMYKLHKYHLKELTGKSVQVCLVCLVSI